jgi:hypothetical protein
MIKLSHHLMVGRIGDLDHVLLPLDEMHSEISTTHIVMSVARIVVSSVNMDVTDLYLLLEADVKATHQEGITVLLVKDHLCEEEEEEVVVVVVAVEEEEMTTVRPCRLNLAL